MFSEFISSKLGYVESNPCKHFIFGKLTLSSDYVTFNKQDSILKVWYILTISKPIIRIPKGDVGQIRYQFYQPEQAGQVGNWNHSKESETGKKIRKEKNPQADDTWPW